MKSGVAAFAAAGRRRPLPWKRGLRAPWQWLPPLRFRRFGVPGAVHPSALPRRVGAALAAQSAVAQAQNDPSRILITNVDIFDGVNETLIENGSVVVEGNLITAVLLQQQIADLGSVAVGNNDFVVTGKFGNLPDGDGWTAIRFLPIWWVSTPAMSTGSNPI